MLQLGKRIYNLIEEQFGSGQPNRTIVTLPLVTKKVTFLKKVRQKVILKVRRRVNIQSDDDGSQKRRGRDY